MPIPFYQLDDRSFEDLVSELLARIPGHTPEWTNPRVGDPGRTIIELFAWLADTPMAVPAPLHVLRGPVEVKVSGRGDPRGREQRLELDASARLARDRQRVFLGAKGELVARDPLLPERKLTARADVVLDAL